MRKLTRRNWIALTTCTAAGGVLLAKGAKESKEGWKCIFDGKSLKGWKANEHPENWKIEDGCIVGRGPRSHLFYVAEEFKNFELKVEVMTQPRTNSGIYFHTRYQASGWPEYGYESQVNVTHPDPVKTGSLYGVVKLFSTPVKDRKWWTHHIIVRGKRIITILDGKVIFEYVEPPGVTGTRKLSKGLIAFQQHDPRSVIRYRNVMVKRLPDDAR